MIHEILSNIFSIDVPLPNNPLKILNSYFIRGAESSLLIDTGFKMPECREALTEGLRMLGADLSKTDIFVTHLHADHSGLAPELIQKGRKIYISNPDCEALDTYRLKEYWENFDKIYAREGFPLEILKELEFKNPARAFAPTQCNQYFTVKDGDLLEYGGYTLRCIDASGHTPGQLCLYEPDNKLMFLGDHVLFDITPNIVSWARMENALKVYLDNLLKFKEFDIALPLPGHRSAGRSLSERIDEIILHHHQRLDETLGIVEAFGGQTSYQIAGQMSWRIRAKSWEDFPSAQKWFAVGETMAHLIFLREEGILRQEFINGVNIYFLNEKNI